MNVSSPVVENPRLYAISFPAKVVTTVAGDQPGPYPGNGDALYGWRAQVTGAPVGSALTAAIKVFRRSDLAVLRTLATVTIADGAFTADGTFAYDTLLTTEAIGIVVTQAGTGTPAENLVVEVYATVLNPSSIPAGPTGPTGAAGAPGALTLVQTVDVTITDAQDVTFSGLSGETDGRYLIKADIITGAGGNSLVELRPNGGSANLSYVNVYGTGAVSGSGGGATAFVAQVGSEGAYADVEFNPRTGKARRGMSKTQADSGSIDAVIFSAIRWDDDSTPITSLVLHSSVVNGIGIGSRFSLYKLAE